MGDGIFKDITLSWDGQEYTLKGDDENSFLKAIAIVEDHVSIGELAGQTKPPISRISQAYGALLRYLGARVTDADVYRFIYTSGPEEIQQAVLNLVMMMVPPDVYDAGEEEKKPEADSEVEKD